MVKLKFMLWVIFLMASLSSCSRKNTAFRSDYHEKQFNGSVKYTAGMDSTLGTFIELKNGKVLKPNKIEYVVAKAGVNVYFLADGVQIDPDNVVKMQNDVGYYEKGPGGSLFVRVNREPISNFTHYYIAHSSYQTNSAGQITTRSFGYLTSEGAYYHNNEFVNYKEVLGLVKSQEESLAKYKEMKKQNRTYNIKRLISFIPFIPATIITASYAKQEKKFNDGESTEKPSKTGLYVAGGLAGSSIVYATILKRKRYRDREQIIFQDAVDEYNYWEKRRLQKNKK